MKILLDDMILTKDLPTTAGSRMLDGYMSLFDATVVEKLVAAGHEIAGKSPVGEFAIDLVGETNYQGGAEYAAAKALKNDPAQGVIALDVNGAPRRVAAQSDLVFVKPTYGTVSRFGTVAVACSGETVGVMAKTAKEAAEILNVIKGHDEKDGTMHREVPDAAPVKRVAVLKMAVDAEVQAKIDAEKARMAADGIEICEIVAGVIESAGAAWNILMCAELCNNVSRFDGVKYGYRTKNYKSLDELYTNSRTEAFGLLLKSAILYGSDVLSTKNYMAKYDKAMRVRRVIAEKFAEIFGKFDAVLMPACSKMSYTDADSAFEENAYTAPASITGLPSVVANGVQLLGRAFSEFALLDLMKEGK